MTSQTIKKSSLSSLLSMIRPANSFLVGFAVVVGIAVSSNNYRDIFSITSLLGFFTGFFISSFSMISNDIYDYEVDRVNQPGRPLPSGAVKLGQARNFSIILLVLGLACSFPLGIPNLAIAAVFAFIGWYYNFRAKKSGLVGNSLVALSLAIPYIFGSIALGNYTLNLGYLLALTSFLAGMGREVLKGVSDVEGDKIRNVRTVASTGGVASAKLISALFFLLAVASSALPLIFGLLGRAFLIYVGLILIPDAIFLYLAYRVLKLTNGQESLQLKTFALGGMMLGLVVYLISGLTV
ncbi:MAG: geranylgeranylglycerol-phosphate geranylgeranyltransferase [Thaumarchaeota archaeon]|nr:geranylgeranylglycerol-phosphate geranylgeranyltransferase [Nitrososphaerota archaeon]